MRKVMFSVAVLLLLPTLLLSDAGVLIPRNQAQPNPSVLSLEEMEVTVRIDNGDARVFMQQVFMNHTPNIEEGEYVFALPSNATVSDFAVWDGPTRIPAVILERRRAEELYDQLKQQSIDPGLLQMGERGTQDASRTSVFSARIVPIPAFGTKRLEFEYHESVPVENLKSYFALPLRPDAYQTQVARHLTINFELDSAHSIANFEAPAKSFPLQIEQNTAHQVKAHFAGDNVNLAEDFVTTFDLDQTDGDTLQVLTYRDPTPGQPSPAEGATASAVDQSGFFAAQVLLAGNPQGATPAATLGSAQSVTSPPKTVIALMDTSLSMQWEKLERSYQALETMLRTLRPTDRFNVILFNNATQMFQPSPAAADPGAIQRALDFVRGSRLRGGTNLQLALESGLQQCSTPGNANPYLVLFSDGGATRGPVQNGRLNTWYEANWKRLPPARRPKTYIFGVGDDANLPLLTMLARQDGVLEHVLSTEPMDFKLTSFLSKIGRSPVGQLRLDVAPSASVNAVYPLQESAFPGSIAAWVGRYQNPQSGVAFTMSGVRDGVPLSTSSRTVLPAQSLDHTELPRLWARARVDSLLAKIQRDGEDQATIDEIIRLARQYKFVTPYTSFLAVPRALLRPRVIRPGDPVLRIQTDESIVSVVALFPFGLVKTLRYLPGEDVWQTRFLAPTDMQDGTYSVRLVLRDRSEHTYREAKTFVIASKPPVIQIKLDRKRFQPGETLNLEVSATESTRTLVARLDGTAPVELKWDARAGSNTGELLIPEQTAPGTYKLTVTGEDIAHNIGTQAVDIEIVP
jgi:Ca-activated chloride channel family protein